MTTDTKKLADAEIANCVSSIIRKYGADVARSASTMNFIAIILAAVPDEAQHDTIHVDNDLRRITIHPPKGEPS